MHIERENTEPTATNGDDIRRVPSPSSITDPADEIPVPIAMSPAEIDERAQAVEAVRAAPLPPSLPSTTDTSETESPGA